MTSLNGLEAGKRVKRLLRSLARISLIAWPLPWRAVLVDHGRYVHNKGGFNLHLVVLPVPGHLFHMIDLLD